MHRSRAPQPLLPVITFIGVLRLRPMRSETTCCGVLPAPALRPFAALTYRLEPAGTFQFRFAATKRKELAAWEVAVLLEAIDWSKGKTRKSSILPESAPQVEESEIIEPRRAIFFVAFN